MKRLKQIWTSLEADDRGLLNFFAAVLTVAFLWAVTVAYGLGFSDGHDTARTPHIPPTTELNELIR